MHSQRYVHNLGPQKLWKRCEVHRLGLALLAPVARPPRKVSGQPFYSSHTSVDERAHVRAAAPREEDGVGRVSGVPTHAAGSRRGRTEWGARRRTQAVLAGRGGCRGGMSGHRVCQGSQWIPESTGPRRGLVRIG